MIDCPNCGTSIEEGKKFCRHCGSSMPAADGEAATWHLPPNPPITPDPQSPTSRINPGVTGPQGQPTGSAYMPPVPYYTPPPPPVPYYPPVEAARSNISLGEWLSSGWSIYKENWLLMSLATLLGGFLSLVSLGVLAGPFLLGLYRMAFKTMRGERPVLGDLFEWEGRFLQAFLACLIFAVIQMGLSAGRQGGLVFVLGLLLNPALAVALAFAMPLILDRGMDVTAALNTAGRMLWSRDKFMWWLVGLVLIGMNFGGAAVCGFGFLITFPWTVCAAAIAYARIFGIDDPNRTLH